MNHDQMKRHADQSFDQLWLLQLPHHVISEWSVQPANRRNSQAHPQAKVQELVQEPDQADQPQHQHHPGRHASHPVLAPFAHCHLLRVPGQAGRVVSAQRDRRHSARPRAIHHHHQAKGQRAPIFLSK